jgi:hypothetical protein
MFKKLLLFIVVPVVLALAFVYIFIPNHVNLKATKKVEVTLTGLNRMLQNPASVAKWWPGKISHDSLILDDYCFQIRNSNITLMPVFINGHGRRLESSLILVELQTDSVQLDWVGAMTTSYNPVERWNSWREAKKLEEKMALILDKIENHYKVPVNIYGYDIKKELVADSLLVATSGGCTGFPGNPFIYGLIGKLKSYAASKGAAVAGFPMLNVSTTDSIHYDVKVALPVDKDIPGSGDILQKRMLGRGNILVTEVTGGIATTYKAMDQVKKYAGDYKRVPPAIPFFSLVTDRLNEPDSSKWVTRVYFPVM